MRHTLISSSHSSWFTDSDSTQRNLDAFWNLIENHYEEDWHIEANGDLVFTVDSKVLENVLADNYATAWYKYGTFMGGEKDGVKFLLNRPEWLIGTYVIKGVYDATQRLVNGARTYHFIQG